MTRYYDAEPADPVYRHRKHKPGDAPGLLGTLPRTRGDRDLVEFSRSRRLGGVKGRSLIALGASRTL